MASYNRVILMGHLTRDPELRFSPKGVAVAAFGLAMNHSWTDEAGNKKDSVCFADITAFGKRGETLAQYLQKGDPLLLEGRLATESWTDKATNQPRSKLKVILESFTFVGQKKEGGEHQEKPPAQPPAASPASHQPGDAPPPEDDDVPF